jgi:carbonic anhydrase
LKIVEISYRYGGSDGAARTRPTDSDSALDRLNEGSRAFETLLDSPGDNAAMARRIIPVDPRDLGLAPGESRAPDQRPFAAVLGCSDARVPIELIFNEGPNDLFVVRVAGNGLGAEVLGSLTYAVNHLGGSLKLVVVLGHSGCGAVKAAVDVFLDPRAYLALGEMHALRSILDRLLIVIHAAAKRLAAFHGPDVTRRRGYREALTESAIASNAALAAYTVQRQMSDERLRAAYGVYLLSERRIWAPRHGTRECAGLAYPPSDVAACGAFADAVVQSDRITSLLEHGSR